MVARYRRARRQLGPHRVRPGPGRAGKSQSLHLVRALSGFTVSPAPQGGDNLMRFGATQLALPGGQCKDPARCPERGVPHPRRLSKILPMTTRSMPAANPWKCSNRQMRNWGLYKPGRTQAKQLRVEKGRLMRRRPKARTPPLAGNRGFESTSLQQRVRLSPVWAFVGREARISARMCAAGLATGSGQHQSRRGKSNRKLFHRFQYR
jgi:hypothetical protein